MTSETNIFRMTTVWVKGHWFLWGEVPFYFRLEKYKGIYGTIPIQEYEVAGFPNVYMRRELRKHESNTHVKN